jgi:adenylate cyclase
MSLFGELKRRNVLRVGAAYMVVSWLLIQVTETIFPLFGFDDAPARIVVVVLAIGLIPVLVFAWVFELTPEGLKKESEVDRSQSITPHTGKKLDRMIMVVLTLALGYFAFDKFVLSKSREATLVEEARQKGRTEALVESYGDQSIAVLAFDDMSPESDQEYLSDGIAEELLNLLAKIPELRVISRSSAFSFKGQNLELTEIAKRLNVAHILEGSVRKSGNRVRITAQLIEARSDTHLWSETYDRTLDDVFAIQDEIAATVVERLKVTLLGDKPHVETTDPRAYTLTLQARHVSRRLSAESYDQATVLYEQALAIDPDYVEALGGLAVLYINRAVFSLSPAAESFGTARELLLKALAIDPRDVSSYVGLAAIAQFGENDLAAAARYYEQALELGPTDISVISNAAVMLLNLGRLEQAVTLQEYATSRDPLNPIKYNNLGTYYFYSARLDDAIEAYRKALSLSPNARYLHYNIGLALILKGQPEDALEELKLEADADAVLQATTMALYLLGRQQEYESSLVEAVEQLGNTSPLWLAQIYALAGDADETFAWLTRAVEQNDVATVGQFLEPYYESVYADPRWKEYLQHTGTSQEQRDEIEFEVKLPH